MSTANDYLAKQAEKYLQKLCLEIPGRRTGSAGNRMATAYLAEIFTGLGLQTTCPEFDCLDWEHGEARLLADHERFEAQINPYSLGCQAKAVLGVASTMEELEAVQAAGQILLLRGQIASEQLMPKNFSFYNPKYHQKIIRLLESNAPQAIIAATTRNPELAGAVYPFPLIEDGDFDIPSIYMTEEQGKRLVAYTGRPVSLEIDARRIPAKGCNVIARTGHATTPRVVLTAHIDAKEGTPGALDNAAGVVVLLLLAELLANENLQHGIELVAFNGEDHYSAAGEVHYFQSNQGILGDILLNINLDGVGYIRGDTGYSLYGCPDALANLIHTAFAPYSGVARGEPWYQGDHSAFIQNQVPALAITSEALFHILEAIAHTDKDVPELVDPSRLAEVAQALRDLLLAMDKKPSG